MIDVDVADEDEINVVHMGAHLQQTPHRPRSAVDQNTMFTGGQQIAGGLPAQRRHQGAGSEYGQAHGGD